ncbi:MAG: hypothetical protein HOV68_28855 [Streptomycetaceae bacterium]|nr:hypothetical protein [Streptomycetaceae bacterium]
MSPTWRQGVIELAPGFRVVGPDGAWAERAEGEFAIEGGYVHLRIAGVAEVQIVSAPAVRRIAYPPQGA